VEIGWRLRRAAWRQGYATEGAKRCLQYAWEHLGLDEVVSFTATINRPSKHMRQKAGMTFSGTFAHPLLPDGYPLQPHVLYRVSP